MAIVRNGWLKTGPFAYQMPFASDVVPHYPSTLRVVCCSGHGHDTADLTAMTARRIWYCNTPDAEKLFAGQPVVYHASVDEMIPHVDCILLAARYTPATHHLLSTKQFSLAKQGGLRVVNVARGQMIDEDALLRALDGS